MLGGLVSVVIAILVYYVKKHAETRCLRYNLADMLSVEIYDIGMRVESDRFNRPDQGFLHPLPRRTCEGLVSSGNVASFDKEIQIKLYYFYYHVENNDTDRIRSDVTELISTVDGFRDGNRRWYRR